MILYLDSSAIVKRYIAEAGSQDVNHWITTAHQVSTGLLARVETSAAICRAAHLGWLGKEESRHALDQFRAEWESFARLPVSEATVRRADELACRHNLCGYDAVHLASVLLYQDGLGLPVTLVTYDHSLWRSGQAEGLAVLPEVLP